MKKPNPIAESFAEMEQRIRQDERLTTLAGLWKHIHLLDKRFVDLAKDLDELKAYIPTAPTPGIATGEFRMVSREQSATPAPKRKAVTANASEIDAAFEVLSNTKPPFSPLSPQNVAAVWRGEAHAYRKAGAALKALVADGRATVKRGKYAQAQPPQQTADGATSEVP